MKLILFIFGFALLSSFQGIETFQGNEMQFNSNNDIVACKYSRCQATAKSTGMQCKHCVSNRGDIYCYQHD